MNMKTTSSITRTRLFIKHVIPLCAILALAGSEAVKAQQTVFSDNFASSTLDQTNAFPGGTPTASSTSYTLASGKNITSSSITANHLLLIEPATSSANSEVQAMFTKYPVTLASVGDYVELTYTFTDRTNQLNGAIGNGTGFQMGLYNSGGTPPLGGTILASGGVGSGTTAYIGGVSNWMGYLAQMTFSVTGSPWYLQARKPQVIAQNSDQELLYNITHPAATTVAQVTPAAPYPFPNLTIGAQYTAQLRITLAAAGTLSLSNGLYAGIGTGGTLIFSNIAASVTGANVLSTNFDGLALGIHGAGGGSWTNDINAITVVSSLAAQAGPYFTVTGSGNGCGGSDIGLSGSVTTNVYLLYTNGVFNGNTLAGTGNALDFGTQRSAAVYTIEASNTVTGSVGPMDGSQAVSDSAPVITQAPASFTGVTNSPVSFSIAATGISLSYQWFVNNTALTNGAEISGAQSTILQISGAQAADAASGANGYYVVVQNPCGESVTSSPNASLTLTAPNNLVWQGNNPNDNWDLANTLNFTNLSGAFEAFSNGDNVTFDDSSPNTSVTLETNLVATLVTFNGTQAYNVAGPGYLTGFAELIDNDSGIVTITSTNDYTGGTIINSNATLSLGNGGGNGGSVSGVVTVNTNGTLLYNYLSNANIYNSLAGNGTVNYEDTDGDTLTIPANGAVSSNFNGTINLGYNGSAVVLHASDGNAGYAFGNGSTVNVPVYCQAWCDRSSTVYNNIFNIAGTGAASGTGAISIFGSTFTGGINLTGNAMLGGSISGGTILCAITGNYQLQVKGTAGSYVLSLGPTNGVDTYASTLITAGSIRALNTNAISRGPLVLDLQGDLRLNGNNLSVSNLASASPGAGSGATIENISATIPAILTFGTDDSSQEFDGIFTNGSTASLGLTKVGAGVETLTGTSVNTGTVDVQGGTLLLTGSGSFNNAAVIAVGNGATYDVTGTSLPLTLNSGQTLIGGGTVNGGVIASAGSTINPGDTIGALTVSGNLTLSGAVLIELNRANSPATNDSIVVTGGTLTAGGTLTVTNLGPALHIGDSFQLFGTGVSGFSSISLETNDTVNGYAYTWNNAVAGNGTITVATAIPVTVPSPVAGFAGTPTNIFVTQTVTFTNTSTGSFTNSVWNFGDGNFVTNSGVNADNNATDAYASAGTYTVSLTVNGAGGASTSTQAAYIVVQPRPLLARPSLIGGQLVFGGSNGPVGQQYRILTSTNIKAPLSSWVPVFTNTIGAGGTYSYTNSALTNAASFFQLVSP